MKTAAGEIRRRFLIEAYYRAGMPVSTIFAQSETP
jgi:hypothetical protein